MILKTCLIHLNFEMLQKKPFAMIWQLGLSKKFVTFTYPKRLQYPLIKKLHALHATKWNFHQKKKPPSYSHNINDRNWPCRKCKTLWSWHIFLQIYDKYDFFKDYISTFFIIKVQNHKSEHDHGILWIKYAPMYGMHTNEKLNNL
jgi:hypothetical protein